MDEQIRKELDDARKAALAAQVKIDDLTKQLAEKTAALTAEAEKIATFTATASTELETVKRERDELHAKVRLNEGELLLKSYEGKVKPFHLKTADGKPTALAAMAFSQPDQFRQIAELIADKVPSLSQHNRGTDEGSETVSFVDAQMARATELQKANPKLDRKHALIQARKELETK